MKGVVLGGLAIALGLLFFGPVQAKELGPLETYVTAADDSYAWTERRRGTQGEATWVELTLTSQTWRDIPWKHQLYILKPSKVRDSSRALLLIGGGVWNDELAEPPKEGDALPSQANMLIAAAEQFGTPIAVLLQVPQQPLFDGMVEDQLISYTFERYLRTGDATWPLLAPMVKSAVRGMDAVQAFAKKEWSYDVASFTVTGASKRGWTTWLTAAVDPRVKALAPMVIDTLNMASQTALQLTSWGKFSDQIHDYTERGLQGAIATPKGQVLLKMIDPYFYREEIQQPKLIILGTNDRYWPLEALNLYWHDLPGKKYVLYTPNQGHGIKDITRVVGSLSAFHRAALGELTLPVMNWQFTAADGATTVVLTSDVKPQSVAVWTTESKTRDFRDSLWKSEPVAEQDGRHTYTQASAAGVYRAMFLEGVFDGGGTPYYLSTNVRVVSPAK